MIRKILLAAASLLCAGAVALFPMGSQMAENSTEPAAQISVIDALGNNLSLENPPERIIQAGKSAFMLINTMYLFEEARERLVGMTKADQGMGFFAEALDPQIENKAVYGQNVSIEEMISLNPDLIIIKDFLAESMKKAMEPAGIPVFSMNLENPENFYKEVEMLGRIFNNPERAESIVSWYREKMSTIFETVRQKSGEERPRVLLVYYSVKDGITSFSVPPLSWIQSDMIRKCGGIPVWKGMSGAKGWTKVGIEQIASWDPDSIFLVSYRTPAPEVVMRMKEDQMWKALSAVRNNRLYAFPADFHSWDQPDPRWVLGYRWTAGILNSGELSSDSASIEAFAREFYSFAYSMDDEEFNRTILPKLQGAGN